MNLQDQVVYRCIHAACARQLPRRVNFCPWCGTGQRDDIVNPDHVARPAPAEYVAAAPVMPPAPQPAPVPAPAAVAPPVQPAAPSPSAPPARQEPSFVTPVAATAAAATAAAAAPAAPASAAAAPVSAPNTVTPPPPVPPRPAAPSGPPRREPVRLRYWLMALAALWLIWLVAKPDGKKKIEERIDSAIVASKECRFNDAQSELIALRMTKATPEQLQRLQSAINDAGPACNKKKAREKAWDDTREAVENFLGAGEFNKAQARLAKFTDRYREDDETRKLKARISQQRADAAPIALPVPVGEELPPPRPVRSTASTAQSVRNLIEEADRALRAGDYLTASEKLEICITMVDEGNRECAAFKVHADRMQRDKERCLASGRAWQEDRCR